MKKLLNYFVNTILALTVVIALLLFGIRIFGIKPLVVISGSMQPSIKVGSVVYIKKSDNYKKGDIITFNFTSSMLATHRIVKIEDDNYTTKGDANNSVDGKIVKKKDIVGKVIFKLPYLGYFAAILKEKLSKFIIFIVIIIILAANLFNLKERRE